MRPLYYRLSWLLAATFLPLAGCGSDPTPNQAAATGATRLAANAQKPVATEPEEGMDTESNIFTVLGLAKKPSQRQNGPQVGTDVSPSLWLAAHDALNFVKIASEDPMTGMLVTDWYTPSTNPNERLRVSVFILSYALRSDSLALTVDREVRGSDGQWKPSTVDRKTVDDLDNAILLRARQIHAETYRKEVLAQ